MQLALATIARRLIFPRALLSHDLVVPVRQARTYTGFHLAEAAEQPGVECGCQLMGSDRPTL